MKRQSLNEAIAYVQNNWMADTKGASHRAIAKELRAKNVNNDKKTRNSEKV